MPRWPQRSSSRPRTTASIRGPGRSWTSPKGVRRADRSSHLAGVRVVVVAGVTIGDGAIIAAGAVVTSDIPPNSVAAGVPARVVGEGGWGRRDPNGCRACQPAPPPHSRLCCVRSTKGLEEALVDLPAGGRDDLSRRERGLSSSARRLDGSPGSFTGCDLTAGPESQLGRSLVECLGSVLAAWGD